MLDQIYNKLIKIDSYDFHNKSILIIGAGRMAYEYTRAAIAFNIDNITIIGNSKKNLKKFKDFPQIKILDGGFRKNIKTLDRKDLVIIATPISELCEALKSSLENNQKNILVEKPGSINIDDLKNLKPIIKNSRVRIGYNRLLYPSFHKLKLILERDEKILSCKFDLTEWVSTIEFGKDKKEIYEKWGISNSLHVISMVFELIGFPKKISTIQSGKLNWHPSGSVFVGSGISEKDIPFSYHANWEGSGRWMIEIVTKKNTYRMGPLEKLFYLQKKTFEWKEVPFITAFPELKTGIAEEIFLMLNNKYESEYKMTKIDKAIKYNKIASIIFGYNN